MSLPRPAPATERLALLLLAASPLVWVGPALLQGHAMLPVSYLQQIAPWGQPPADGGVGRWNALTWDAVAYFAPSRAFAAESLRAGHVPLWNPHELCGTPFLANVQSAVLYPLGLLFWLLPTALAFGPNAWLHLALLGLFAYGWLRAEGLSRPAGLFGALALQWSGWAVVWIELPTFLQVAAWLPLLLWALCPREPDGSAGPAASPRLRAAAGSLAVALMLLGGHLQLAFYCLLAALVYTLVRGPRAGFGPLPSPAEPASSGGVRPEPSLPVRSTAARLALLVGIAALGALAASAQLLPAMELSRWGHRQGGPSPEAYSAFLRQGMPAAHLVTALVPDFYGNPRAGGYWGPGRQEVASFTELSCYLGLLSWALALLGLGGWRRSGLVRAMGVLWGLGWLLALGTHANGPLYYLVPGFSQFGTPSRALLVVVVAQAALAAAGLHRALEAPERRKLLRPTLAAVAAVGLLAALLAAAAALSLPRALRTDLASLEAANLARLLALLALSGLLLAAWCVGRLSRRLFVSGAFAVLALDLLSFGAGYVLSGRPDDLFRGTRLTRFLAGAGLDRVLVITRDWPLHRTPVAVLPPNTAQAYGVYSVGGYESLYLRQFKEALNRLQGGETSPVTNGNLVYPGVPTEGLLRATEARHVISPAPVERPYLRPVFAEERSWVYEYAGWRPRLRVEGAGPGQAVDGRQVGPNRLEASVSGQEGRLVGLSPLALTPGWVGYVVTGGSRAVAPLSRDGSIALPAAAEAAGWEYRPDSYKVGLFASLMGVGLLGALVGRSIAGVGGARAG